MVSRYLSMMSGIVGAFCVAFAVIVFQMLSIEPDYYLGDAFAYLSVAKGIVDTGVFTDGGYAHMAVISGPNGAGMFFSPLYPSILSVMMWLDPQFYETVSCHIELGRGLAEQQCGHYFGVVFYLHGILAVLSASLVWLAANIITQRRLAAWIAMVLALVAECYAYYTGQVMTENVVFPLFSAATLLFVKASTQGCEKYWLVTGVMFGVLVLARPSFIYLFYALTLLGALLLVSRRQWTVGRKAACFFLLVAGYCIITGPWVIRNGAQFGHWTVSQGYGSFILAQRAAFNEMRWDEWRASFVYGLPDFGDSLVKDFYPPQSYERFDYDNPNGFYQSGQALIEQTRQEVSIPEEHLSYVLRNYVLAEPLKHVMVTLSLAWRGMWVSKYWGLVAILVFLGVLFYAFWRRWWSFVLFSLPPWFMLGLHAFTSVNVVRYNLVLIPCLSIAVAFTLVCLWDRIRAMKQFKAEV